MKIIEFLLPHRPPFLMVEAIIDYVGGDAPILNAERTIRRSEPVFSGAEPPLHWPSVYIIEGLGQCCSLLRLIWTCERRYAANTSGAENISNLLTNTDGAEDNYYALERLFEIFGNRTMNTASRIGMLASVDVEVVSRVRVGELLEYKVEQTHVLENLSRFAVQASVDTQVVAHGTIVGAQLENYL